MLLLTCACASSGPERKEGLLKAWETIPCPLDDAPPLLRDNAPAGVMETIMREFPGAEIREVEEETWGGSPAWEVELTTPDGDEVELMLSRRGMILERSEGLPLIGGELSLGLGTFWEKSVYKGVGDEFEPVPLIRYFNGPFRLVTEDGIEASMALYQWEDLTCGPLLAMHIGEGFDAGDSKHLRGMKEPDETTYVGGMFANYETPEFGVEFRFLNELSEHNGQQIEVSLEKEWEFGGVEIEPSVFLQFQSSRWTDYYYGVSRVERRSWRRPYDPDAALNVGAELMARYELMPGLDLIGMVECTRLANGIKRSPIVETGLMFDLFVGIMYSF